MKINGSLLHSYQAPQTLIATKKDELHPIENHVRLPENKFKAEEIGDVINIPGTKYKAVFLKRTAVEKVIGAKLREFWNHNINKHYETQRELDHMIPIENRNGYLLNAYTSDEEIKKLITALDELSPRMKMRLPSKIEDKKILNVIKNSSIFKKSGLVDFKCEVKNSESERCYYEHPKNKFSIISRGHVESTGVILLIEKED